MKKIEEKNIIIKIPINKLELSEIQTVIYKCDDNNNLLICEESGLKGCYILAKYSTTGKDYFIPIIFMNKSLAQKIADFM